MEKLKAFILISAVLLCFIYVFYPLTAEAMADRGEEKNTPLASSIPGSSQDELEAARNFIKAKERFIQLQRASNSTQKEIAEAQEILRRARIRLQTALLHETTQDLTQNLERTGERAKELFEKTSQESNTLLQDLLQQLEKIIPGSEKPSTP
jgi:DNA anti-recombination protein RmuC